MLLSEETAELTSLLALLTEEIALAMLLEAALVV